MSRIIPLLGCAAGCAIAGCSATRSHSSCTNCAPVSGVAHYDSAYENYTPPPTTLQQSPAPPAEDTVNPPPPPQTLSIPNNQVDFFESASNRTKD